MESKTLFLENAKLNIEYCDIGEGKDTIFFLCGFGQTFEVFENLFLLLKDDYRIVSINYPGFGKSDPVDQISVEKYAEVISEFASHYRLKNYFLCGDSFGGYMALYYANITNGKNIKALILLSPLVKLYNKKFVNNSVSIFMYNFEKVLFPSKRPSIPHKNEFRSLARPGELMKQGKMVLGVEFDEKLLDLKKDFLVIVGDQDNLVNPHETIKLLSEKPNIKIEKVNANSKITPQKTSFLKRLLAKFKKDVTVEEITVGTHGCYMEIGDKILQIIKNFTKNYG